MTKEFPPKWANMKKGFTQISGFSENVKQFQENQKNQFIQITHHNEELAEKVQFLERENKLLSDRVKLLELRVERFESLTRTAR